MEKQFKFRFTVYDTDGYVETENDYYTLKEISRDYDKIPYATLYYISHYENGGVNNEEGVQRKPSKATRDIMKRISIERITHDDMFKKKV